MSRNSSVAKTCPECGLEFKSGKNLFRREFDKRVLCCPNPLCSEPIFYRTKDGVTDVVLLRDKLCVDNIIRMINEHKTSISGFEYDLGAATARERKFAYDLVEWCRRFMDGAALDIGMTIYEFLERWLKWVLERPWYKSHFDSLLVIRNKRGDLAKEYYEQVARERGVVPVGDEQKLKRKLSRLSAQLSLGI